MTKIDTAKHFGHALARRDASQPMDVTSISIAIHALRDALMAGVREPETRSEVNRYNDQSKAICQTARDAFDRYAEERGNDTYNARYFHSLRNA